MEGIRKQYPSSGVLANDGASLLVNEGEIHALVGENGAGKTTLMRILYGLEKPDAGRIVVGGRLVEGGRPARSSPGALLSLGMVQQHFTTVSDFSAAENVVLGAEPRRFGFVFDRARAEKDVESLALENGFSLDPAAPASSLSIGQRQEVEILKLLYRKADVLILDEPTAVLAEQEIEGLFATLRRLRAKGKTIIVITHKVREVMSLADSVTVMRRGRTVARLRVASITEEELSRLMMGGTSIPRIEVGPAESVRLARPAGAGNAGEKPGEKAAGGRPQPGNPVFEMRSVSVHSRRRGFGGPWRPMDSISLSVRPGEILGVTGVVGNGLGTLEDLVSGFARQSSGEILIDGKPRPLLRHKGISYVPADRAKRGVSLASSVEYNLAALDRARYFPHGIVDRGLMRRDALAAIAEYGIAAGPESEAAFLSGGNMQKLVIAREFAGEPAFLFFSNPTWGLDIGSADFVHGKMLEARSRGAAILLISANLDEILSLSDRVSVMCRGRIVCSLGNNGELDRVRLGEYMLGLRDDFLSGIQMPLKTDSLESERKDR